MTKEQKPYFELLNNFWTLLKPYASKEDEKAYKKIMSDNFLMLTKDRGDMYTDDWYDSTMEIINYPDNYKGTKFVEFAAELAIAITDYWTFEFRKMKESKVPTYQDFVNYVSKAFINEWERIKDAGNKK